MRTNIFTASLMSAMLMAGGSYCQASNKSDLTLQRQADTLTFVNITQPTRYLLLPIEEDADEVKVRLDLSRADDTDMDVRLAHKSRLLCALRLKGRGRHRQCRCRRFNRQGAHW